MTEPRPSPDAASPLTDAEVAALYALPRHGTRFEIEGAIGRDTNVVDLFGEPGAYDRRILLVTLRSALASRLAAHPDSPQTRQPFTIEQLQEAHRTAGTGFWMTDEQAGRIIDTLNGGDTSAHPDSGAEPGYTVWKAWRDGMLRQGRDVSPERMAWETLTAEDKALDAAIERAVGVGDSGAEVAALQEALAEIDDLLVTDAGDSGEGVDMALTVVHRVLSPDAHAKADARNERVRAEAVAAFLDDPATRERLETYWHATSEFDWAAREPEEHADAILAALRGTAR